MIKLTPGILRATFSFLGKSKTAVKPNQNQLKPPKTETLKLDNNCKYIIELIESKNYDKQKLIRMLLKYLSFQDTLLDHINKPNICALLLSIEKLSDPQLGLYSRRLVQFLLRMELNDMKFSDECLNIILKYSNLMKNESQIKTKFFIFKIFIANLVSSNFEKINQQNFSNILDMLDMSDRQQNEISIQGGRFISIIDLIQRRFDEHFLSVERYNYSKVRNILFILHKNIHIYRIYGVEKDIYAINLYNFLVTATPISRQKLTDEQIFITVAYIYRNFPSVQKDKSGVTLKQRYKRFLFEECFKKINFSTVSNKYQVYFFISYMYHIFSESFSALKFKQEKNLNYIVNADLKVPVLSEQIENIFDKCFQNYPLNHSICSNVIKKIYPHKQKWCSKNIKQQRQTLICTKNEIGVRSRAALELLNLEYKAQQQVCGRIVDYLLEDNIIIEFDGTFHFHYRKMILNESTQNRNMHLLLSGYKIIIIYIFQYHQHRTTFKLADLIKQKIQLMKQKQAVMVI